ncbi:uncharacterized protein DEA37_0014051 [Paragonimus westermani]|uniref:Uncharacterized protein n=1 Tax=Paragonimus westermani TaxID=34504 RepID=A0A5J4NFX5_9TREM|nr:uncharacterized protein DEA37_0014051 [Paragonimus westermani]
MFNFFANLVAERLPPGIKVGTNVKLLVPSMCRSVRVYAVNKTNSVHRNDVELPTPDEQGTTLQTPCLTSPQLVVFTGMLPRTSDPSTNWEERIYYNPEEACPPKGLISPKQCIRKSGGKLDVFTSLPRFLHADARIVKKLDGILEPSEIEHGSFIHVEPLTGLALEGHERVQLNIFMANKNKGMLQNRDGGMDREQLSCEARGHDNHQEK